MTLTNLVVIQRRFHTAKEKLLIYVATNHIPMRELDLPKVDRCVKMLRRCHFLQSLIDQALSDHGKKETTKQINDDFDE